VVEVTCNGVPALVLWYGNKHHKIQKKKERKEEEEEGGEFRYTHIYSQSSPAHWAPPRDGCPTPTHRQHAL
jgi:hypothetical protein